MTVVDPAIAEHGGRGRVFKTTGDGLLAAFPSVVEAIRCAVRIQQPLVPSREVADVDRRMALRIGVHVGDVVVSGNDLLGDGHRGTRVEPLPSLNTPSGLDIAKTFAPDLIVTIRYVIGTMRLSARSRCIVRSAREFLRRRKPFDI